MKLGPVGTDMTSSGRLNTTLDWILDPPFVVSPAAKTFTLLFGISRFGCNWEPKATEMSICATSGTDSSFHMWKYIQLLFPLIHLSMYAAHSECPLRSDC